MFFDESSKVIKKNRSKPTASADPALAAQSPSHTSHTITIQHVAPIQLTGVVLYQPLNDLAVHFFMANYVGSDPATSQFDYLPSFYLRDGSPNPELQQSIEAVGLAGYAKATRRSDLVLPATKSYISAIREINNALSSEVSAAQDSTLISVMLLAMFEVMILPRASGLQNLTKHLNGAISIASLRLKQGIHTDIGRRLLSTLVQSVIMNCWMQNIPLPVEFVAFKNHLGGKSNSSSMHANFLDIVMDLVQFRHALTSGAYDSATAIISETLTLEGRFHAFGEYMPSAGQFKSYRSSMEVDDLVYDGYYHGISRYVGRLTRANHISVYPRFFAAHLWNNVRLCRIRLHRVILTQCINLLSSQADYAPAHTQIAESEVTIRDLAQEICASVPQLSGYLERLQSYSKSENVDIPNEPSESAGKTSTSIPLSTHFLYDPSPFKHQRSNPAASKTHQSEPALEFPAPRPESLYHLLYQLHTLSTIKLLPPAMRHWMRARIQWMEASADPEDLSQLRAMLKRKSEDGFPVPVNNEYEARECMSRTVVGNLVR